METQTITEFKTNYINGLKTIYIIAHKSNACSELFNHRDNDTIALSITFKSDKSAAFNRIVDICEDLDIKYSVTKYRTNYYLIELKYVE